MEVYHKLKNGLNNLKRNKMESLIITSLICNFFSFYAIYLLKKDFEQFKKQ